MENCNNSDDVHQCEIDGCEKLFSSENNMKKQTYPQWRKKGN